MNVENPSALARRIGELKREKNAVILAHFYTAPEVQAVADFLGDSLAPAPRRAVRWPIRAMPEPSPPSGRSIRTIRWCPTSIRPWRSRR